MEQQHHTPQETRTAAMMIIMTTAQGTYCIKQEGANDISPA